MRNILGILIVFMSCCSCTELNLQQAASYMVLEGWIEDGKFPVVLLSTSVPVSTDSKDMKSLQDHVVRWGKVTISDGEKEVVLTGGPDDRFIPPYSYTTAKMRGQAGKTYTVKAEYNGYSVTASTTIPECKELEYLRTEEVLPGKFRILAGLKDDPSRKNYYKFFVRREGKDSIYLSSFLGLVNDEVLSDRTEVIAVYNGMSVRDDEFNQYFSEDDVVHIRFSSMDEASWKYWDGFEEIQSLSRNPFFPVSNTINSNVVGGLGYWAGYGSSYYKLPISSSSDDDNRH